MKHILFLFVVIVAGYFVFWGGTTAALSKADITPKDLMSNVAAGVDQNFIPDIAVNRRGFKYNNSNSFGKVKDNVFMTYDPEICFAFIDIAYSSGGGEAESLIREYLKMFTLPEDRAKVLKLLTSYKDKQTLRMLLSFYQDELLERANLLNVLSTYRTPEVAQIINNAVSSDNLILAQTAKQLANNFAEQKWYEDGLNVKISEENKVDKKDYQGAVGQYI